MAHFVESTQSLQRAGLCDVDVISKLMGPVYFEQVGSYFVQIDQRNECEKKCKNKNFENFSIIFQFGWLCA